MQFVFSVDNHSSDKNLRIKPYVFVGLFLVGQYSINNNDLQNLWNRRSESFVQTINFEVTFLTKLRKLNFSFEKKHKIFLIKFSF